MINYLKENHLLLLIVFVLLLPSFSGKAFGATTARTTITNPWTFTQDVIFSTTGTTTAGTQGIPTFYTLGGIDYAAVQMPMTATSSIPAIIPNPFGAATSTLVSCHVQVTANGIAVGQTFDISTTTGAGGYGSSTPAILSGFSTGAGQFTAPCNFNSATSTAAVTNPSGVKIGLLPGMTSTGVSNYIVGPSEYVTTRISSSTPGTFSSYWTGTFSAVFMKP